MEIRYRMRLEYSLLLYSSTQYIARSLAKEYCAGGQCHARGTASIHCQGSCCSPRVAPACTAMRACLCACLRASKKATCLRPCQHHQVDRRVRAGTTCTLHLRAPPAPTNCTLEHRLPAVVVLRDPGLGDDDDQGLSLASCHSRALATWACAHTWAWHLAGRRLAIVEPVTGQSVATCSDVHAFAVASPEDQTSRVSLVDQAY